MNTSSITNYTLGFADPASNWMIAMVQLHDHIIFYMIIISVVVAWLLTTALLNKNHMRFLAHGELLEIVWTCIPAGILWAIGLPSLKLLYTMDEILDSEVTVKATGYQWYWQYSYGDYSTDNEGITFDSFTLADSDLELGSPRKLTTDTSLVLPVNTSIRMIITANDVIHSFGVPSLGVKCDAIPGRLNSVGFIINRPGNIYGMCSELCGSAHSMMNISISAVSLPEYIEFIRSNLNHNYVLKSEI